MSTSLLNLRTAKFFKTAAIFSVVGLLSLSSCKKEESEPAPSSPAPAPTKTQMITAKTWKLSAATIYPDMNGETDMYAMMDNCEKDNTMKFDNSNVVISEGASKCDPMAPQTQTKTWSFASSETVLNISNYSYQLVELKSDKMTISHMVDYMGTTYKITETYSGQ